MAEDRGLYIVLISVHGLLRGTDVELGRDADTGGQILYVLDLARNLARNEQVARVDLLTRQVVDSKVDESYATLEEKLEGCASIYRIPCGPRRYLRKEVLWPHLDSFADNALRHVRSVGRLPDVIHSHYADAGYVGVRLASVLGVPLVHTGHSLGTVKRERLLAKGMKPERMEREYRLTQRIEAEEAALDAAAFVVASTRQEVEDQYSRYANYAPDRMVVIPPGVDLDRFYPPESGDPAPHVREELARFLRDPSKPMVVAIARPDMRKNLGALVRAFGENKRLREIANLVIVAGTRDRIRDLDKGAQEVLTDLLLLADDHDLYGSVAFPKHIEPEEVPNLYRLAAARRGVFVNPALTEPFGLTLIEAAATGLPIVATEDGGPRDIIGHCKNGVLIDPMDTGAMGSKILDALEDEARWDRWSKSGIDGANEYYAWSGHVRHYLREVKKVVGKARERINVDAYKGRLATSDRVLVCDVDDTLIGDKEALAALIEKLKEGERRHAFAIATGRRLDSAMDELHKWGVPVPDLLITSVGCEIHYGPRIVPDLPWRRHQRYRWDRKGIVQAMREIPGITAQDADEQLATKVSYFYDANEVPTVAEIRRHLRSKRLHANVIFSHGQHLDIVPVRVSKGWAVRYVAEKWGIPLDRILACGNSGNDIEMLRGNMLAVVVGNHDDALEGLRGEYRIHFAEGDHAWGIVEGIEKYGFLDPEGPYGEPGADPAAATIGAACSKTADDAI